MVDLRETKEYWEKRTEELEEKAPVNIGKGRIFNWQMTRVHRKQLQKMLKLCNPSSVLEIGVGQGRLFSKINHISKVGIDVSINMLARCCTRNYLTGLVEADAGHLPFKDRSFDLVYTCTVLLHIPTNLVETAISEIKRVADTYIFIIEPSPNFQLLDKPYREGGHCFPHKYQESFDLPIKHRKRLDKFHHEAILFAKP
jgi:SAM-dependent methyltransferase